ncbi:hypothetical protein FKM82_002550 [Ascaphus truei]
MSTNSGEFAGVFFCVCVRKKHQRLQARIRNSGVICTRSQDQSAGHSRNHHKIRQLKRNQLVHLCYSDIRYSVFTKDQEGYLNFKTIMLLIRSTWKDALKWASCFLVCHLSWKPM